MKFYIQLVSRVDYILVIYLEQTTLLCMLDNFRDSNISALTGLNFIQLCMQLHLTESSADYVFPYISPNRQYCYVFGFFFTIFVITMFIRIQCIIAPNIMCWILIMKHIVLFPVLSLVGYIYTTLAATVQSHFGGMFGVYQFEIEYATRNTVMLKIFN